MNKNERNFWLDLMMLCAFSTAIVSGFLLWLVIPNGNASVFAGIERAVWQTFHEISGFLGLLGVIIHIIWHWDWLKALRGRSLRTMKKTVRANRVTNRLIWFAFISSNTFGVLALLLSAHLPTEAIKIFERIHVAAGLVWVVFLAIHLILHQKWIIAATQYYSPFRLVTNNVLKKGNQSEARKVS